MKAPSLLDEDSPTRRIELPGGDLVEIELGTVRIRVLGGRQAGRNFVFSRLPVTVGSEPGSDLVLDDAGISRRHLEIGETEAGLVVRDPGSTNGTFVGDVRIREVVVDRDTRLRVGPVELAIELATEARRGPVQAEDAASVLVGGSEAMARLRGVIRAVAGAHAPVLLLGETGTGKELVARCLHEVSARKGGFVSVDATQCDPATLRSDLFGHAKGAFTGADQARPGAFRSADGGTLFLDELGELPLDVQARLLRVLESREVQPMGSDRSHPVDFRLVAATHRDLPGLAADGKFRLDLLHRVAVVVVRLPPLRERPEDLPDLVAALSARHPRAPRFSPAAWKALSAHPWPGNVRELRNVVDRVAALGIAAEAGPEDLGLDLLGSLALRASPSGSPIPPPVSAPPTPTGPGPARDRSLSDQRSDLEREAIVAALAASGGHRGAAAASLGISVATLWRRMNRFGIE